MCVCVCVCVCVIVGASVLASMDMYLRSSIPTTDPCFNRIVVVSAYSYDIARTFVYIHLGTMLFLPGLLQMVSKKAGFLMYCCVLVLVRTEPNCTSCNHAST